MSQEQSSLDWLRELSWIFRIDVNHLEKLPHTIGPKRENLVARNYNRMVVSAMD
jgi:hypothetical protein